MNGATNSGSAFRGRVAGVFATRIVQFLIGFAISFLLARLLGPEGRGTLYLVSLVPAALFALGGLGLPAAVSFFAGRGHDGPQLQRLSLGIAIILGGGLALATLLALPLLEQNVLRLAPIDLVRVALAALPFQFAASFGGALLIGRQTMRNYNIILIVQSLLSLALTFAVVGWLRLGIAGAVSVNVLIAVGGAVAVGIEARRATRGDHDRPLTRPGLLLGYGARLYPATVTSFFSYRIDVFLLGWLLADAADIGLYSIAVGLAELAFFLPDAVSTVFFPRVVGAPRQSADHMTPGVTRFTFFLTTLSLVALIPAAYVVVYVLLPEFTDSLPLFLVLLPGVVALSGAKVMSSYVSGLGLPLRVAGAASVALVVNVAANLLLIPQIGVMGASVASLVSYTVQVAVLLYVAARLAATPMRAFVIPGRAELRRLVDGLRSLLRGR